MLARLIRSAAGKIYPDHWSFYLGEFALYAFGLLFVTGIWLAFAFDASPEHAFASVVAVDRARPFPYLIRQIHHWSAVIFVAAIVVHMARIFFTAAYRAPREINWVAGVLLLTGGSLAGFTGYSLPYDALSGTGLRIADAVMLAVPVAGPAAALLLNGGPFPGPRLIPNLAFIHVWVIPTLLVLGIATHLTLLFVQKHTQFVEDPGHVVGRRFWPDYALRTVAALCMTVAVVVGIAAFVEINPIRDFGPYTYWRVPNPAAPDWYAGWLDGGLRLGPAFSPAVFGVTLSPLIWPGVVLPGLVFAFVLFWPWIDAWRLGEDAATDVLVPARRSRGRVGVGAALLTAGVVLTLAASDDQQAAHLHVDVLRLVWFYRFALVIGGLGAAFLAAEVARELRARSDGGPGPRERAVVVRRTQSGGFEEEDVPV